MKPCEDATCSQGIADYYCWKCDLYLCKVHATVCAEEGHKVTEVAE